MFEQNQFDLMRDWLIAATKIPDVLLAFKTGPRPDTDYMTLNLISSNPIHGHIDEIYEDDPLYVDGSQYPVISFTAQEYEFTWTLKTFSNDPINMTNRVIPWMQLQQGREMLGALSPHRIGRVNRSPERIDGNWNDRAVTELFMRSIVCTATTNHDTKSILMGSVPTDVIETVSFMFPSGAMLTEERP